MNVSSLYHQCIYITLIILIFTMSVSFINGLGLFPYKYESGPGLQDTTNETFLNMVQSMTGLSTGGAAAVWTLAIGTGFILTGLASIALQSTTPLAIFLFGSIFWTAYTKCFSVIGPYLPTEFVFILWVVSIFLFVGAILGLLGSQ